MKNQNQIAAAGVISELGLMDLPGAKSGEEPAAKRSRVWLWVFVAFAVQIAVWTTWIVIASHHKVQEVPLETATVTR